MRFRVGPASEIPPGVRKIVYPFPGTGIGVFNVEGRYYAVKNTCPHMGAPLCQGKLTGTTQPTRTPDGRFSMEWVRDGEILKCPWHHWEFDIATGRTLFPSRQRVATYEVAVEEGNGSPPADTAGEPGGEQGERTAAPGVETYTVVVEDATVYLLIGKG